MMMRILGTVVATGFIVTMAYFPILGTHSLAIQLAEIAFFGGMWAILVSEIWSPSSHV